MEENKDEAGISDYENDDVVSVGSSQLMADLNEFICESPEMIWSEEVEEILVEFCESESNMSSSDEKKAEFLSIDMPSTSTSRPTGPSHLNIQLNQPVVVLSKLNSQDIERYCSGKNDNVKGCSDEEDSNSISTKSIGKKSGKLSDGKKSVWCDDGNGDSLSELSVSDFSLSDVEVDNMLAESAIDSTGKKINKKDTGGVHKRRNSKEVPQSLSRSLSSKSQQSPHTKSILSPSQSKGKSSGASQSQSKNTAKPKENQESSSKIAVKNSAKEGITNASNIQQSKDKGQKKNTRKESESFSKTEDTSSLKFKSNIQQLKENVGKVNEPSKGNEDRSAGKSCRNWRYELVLTNFNIIELTNESFRKFINLASDCAMDFAPAVASNKPFGGGVSLYFGDFDAIQLAMQKLGQVTFMSTSKLQGQIVGRQLMPKIRDQPCSKQNSDGEWKVSGHGKLFFTLYTAWTEKLKQVVQIRDWKKADKRHEKFAKITSVPTVVGKEFLSLLFPFSINIHPSPNSQNAAEKTKSANRTHPIDVHYASQELMETALGCFQELAVIVPSALVPQTKLYIANVKPKAKPLGHKSVYPGSVQSAKHEQSRQGRLFPCKRHHQQKSHHPPHHHSARQSGGHTSSSKHLPTKPHNINTPSSSAAYDVNRDKKRSSSAATDSTNTLPSGKKTRFSLPHDQTNTLSNAPTASSGMSGAKQMAQAHGLDPNNSDVLCILELQRQLKSMQSLMAQPLPATQSVKEFAEVEQKLRDSIVVRQKQLQELEGKLKTNKDKIQQSKEVTQDKHLTARNAPPPNQNDQPLDFKKPQPKVELAVKADEIRSKITAVVKEPLKSFKKPLSVATSKQASLKVEDCALPLEFGKNVAKFTPKVMECQSPLKLSKNTAKPKTRVSRWSSENDCVSINRTNVQDDGMLPTPAGPFGSQSRVQRNMIESYGQSDKIPKFSDSGRNAVRSGRDSVGRRGVIGNTTDPWSKGQRVERFDTVANDGLLPSPPGLVEARQDVKEGWEPRHDTGKRFDKGRHAGGHFRSLEARRSESKRFDNYSMGADYCPTGVPRTGNVQTSIIEKLDMGGRSGNEHWKKNEGKSVIEKLQAEAFGRDNRGNENESWKEGKGFGQNVFSEQSKSRDSRLSEFFHYDEEANVGNHGNNWHDRERQSEFARGGHSCQSSRGGYRDKQGQWKSSSFEREVESESSSKYGNDYGDDSYYDGNVDFNLSVYSNVRGRGRGGHKRGGRFSQNQRDYSDGYEEEGHAGDWRVDSAGAGDRGGGQRGYGGSGSQQGVGNLSAATNKRLKLDQYQTEEKDDVEERFEQWAKGFGGGKGRDGGSSGSGQGVGGVKGRGSVDAFSCSEERSRKDRSHGKDDNLYDIEKEQVVEYGLDDGSGHHRGNEWEFGAASQGFGSAGGGGRGRIERSARGMGQISRGGSRGGMDDGIGVGGRGSGIINSGGQLDVRGERSGEMGRGRGGGRNARGGERSSWSRGGGGTSKDHGYQYFGDGESGLRNDSSGGLRDGGFKSSGGGYNSNVSGGGSCTSDYGTMRRVDVPASGSQWSLSHSEDGNFAGGMRDRGGGAFSSDRGGFGNDRGRGGGSLGSDRGHGGGGYGSVKGHDGDSFHSNKSRGRHDGFDSNRGHGRSWSDGGHDNGSGRGGFGNDGGLGKGSNSGAFGNDGGCGAFGSNRGCGGFGNDKASGASGSDNGGTGRGGFGSNRGHCDFGSDRGRSGFGSDNSSGHGGFGSDGGHGSGSGAFGSNRGRGAFGSDRGRGAFGSNRGHGSFGSDKGSGHGGFSRDNDKGGDDGTFDSDSRRFGHDSFNVGSNDFSSHDSSRSSSSFKKGYNDGGRGRDRGYSRGRGQPSSHERPGLLGSPPNSDRNEGGGRTGSGSGFGASRSEVHFY